MMRPGAVGHDSLARPRAARERFGSAKRLGMSSSSQRRPRTSEQTAPRGCLDPGDELQDEAIPLDQHHFVSGVAPLGELRYSADSDVNAAVTPSEVRQPECQEHDSPRNGDKLPCPRELNEEEHPPRVALLRAPGDSGHARR
jgi:hypothetical protein